MKNLLNGIKKNWDFKNKDNVTIEEWLLMKFNEAIQAAKDKHCISG